MKAYNSFSENKVDGEVVTGLSEQGKIRKRKKEDKERRKKEKKEGEKNERRRAGQGGRQAG